MLRSVVTGECARPGQVRGEPACARTYQVCGDRACAGACVRALSVLLAS